MMERRMPTRREKYWSESGRGDGQGDMGHNDRRNEGKEEVIEYSRCRQS